MTDENEDEYETYEWAGQKRIRSVTLLNNPAQSIGATSVTKEEYDGELNVDQDDADVEFGKAQFNESDLIPIQSDDNNSEELRKAVIG